MRAIRADLRVALRLKWRALRNDDRALPNFLVVGAQKAGTSSFYGYLARHRQVMRALRKEVHYFDVNYHKGEAWYRRHFPTVEEMAERGGVTGEASPYYMAHPHALSRILRDLPDVKIIVLLRDPVERTISHYFHEVRHGSERLPLLEALAAEDDRIGPDLAEMKARDDYNGTAHRKHSYLLRSRYILQLEPLLKPGRADNLHLIRSEDLFADPAATMRGAFDFLGLKADDHLRAYPVLNRGDGEPVSPETREHIRRLLHDDTMELKRRTGIAWDEEPYR